LLSDDQTSREILISVAGLNVLLRTSDSGVADRISSRYRQFLGTAGIPLIKVDLEIVPGALFIQPKPGAWEIQSLFSEDRLTYQSYLEVGEVDLVTGRGVLRMAPEANVENLLRAIYAWLCLKYEGILLHAAGVVRQGRGYVFFGPSGAGKTTTSGLAARSSDVVSDDLVILRDHDGGWRLHGVPFKGELSDAPRANQEAPLQGIFRLRQDTSHFVEPLSTARSVADLVASAPFVVGQASLSDRLVGLCHRLAMNVPVLQLHLKKDEGFWKAIDDYFAALPAAASANRR
jgi:hypothetical protein